jgi:GNAT superfamily N-acetyltransferase
LGKGKDFIELHELWLATEHRGKGYGKQFFDFFENCMKRKGYDSIAYYAFDPAAVAICRKRGYKEAYGLKEAGPYGKIENMYVFYLRLRKD